MLNSATVCGAAGCDRNIMSGGRTPAQADEGSSNDSDYFDQFVKVRTAKRLVKPLEAISYLVQLLERPLVPPIELADPAARAALPLVV